MGVKRVIRANNGAKVQITIGEAFAEFITEKKTLGVVEKTLHNYVQAYGFFLRDIYNGNDTILVDTITKTDIMNWINLMRLRQTKITTLNSYLRIIRVFLYWCMETEREYIGHPFNIDLVKGQEPLPKIFDSDEIEELLHRPTNKADFVEWRTWAIVNWVLATGNRASTICNIKMGDLDFKNNQVSLQHTKNKKAQIIPLSSTLIRVIKEYIKLYRTDNNGVVNKEDWLFPSIANEQLTYNALAHSFSKYCKERGSSHTNIHGLRHYFSTYWIKQGGSGDKLQRTLGHSTYNMTQRYISLVDNDLVEDFDTFNPLDNIKKAGRRTKLVGGNNG